VADSDGTWASGFSDDGLHANNAGVEAMAQAAATQLRGFVGAVPAGG
jgi:lysophospholipase L1-like esterase